MNFKLKIWRQNQGQAGRLVDYKLDGVSPDSSFLEMLDLLNEQLLSAGNEPIAFDHDCREGICGMCSLTINGVPQGGKGKSTVCQLHMRHFEDNETITIEPFRAKPFPVVKDLVIDRTSLDKIIQNGGYISAKIGSAQDANATLISKADADKAMDAAACIGCGACVAACKNASAMLFVSAKVTHLNTLPQGKPEKNRRVLKMVETMDLLGFGSCTNYGECQAVCPKGISLDMIAKLNRDYLAASVKDTFSSGSDKID